VNRNDARVELWKKRAEEQRQIQKNLQEELRVMKKQQQQQQQQALSKNKAIQSLQSQMANLREELLQGASKQEELNQKTKALDEKLQSSEQEVEAQARELVRAGEEMTQLRTNAKEEREDLQDDHDDELEDLQRNHQAALDEMRIEYEKTIAEWQERFESEESLRQQEGGDSIKELRDANHREKLALEKLVVVSAEKEALRCELDTVVGHETKLRDQVESSLESADAVAVREQCARDELDRAAAAHAKQMAQRQRREAELEQTVLEMGSALTLAKQQLRQQAASSAAGSTSALVPSDSPQKINQPPMDGSYYKEQFEQVAEELETIRVRFTMETQRREALKQELAEVSEEREQELATTQSLQQKHDAKVSDLESTVHRLQASLRALQQQSGEPVGNNGIGDDTDSARNPDIQPKQELEGAKREISSLSERLLRQQALAKNAKSEILALKGRLQAANARADEAEKARYNSRNHLPQPRSLAYDVEGGTTPSNAQGNHAGASSSFSVRRRVKGGSSRGVRSIRSALPCFGSGRSSDGGSGLEQVALTIDAIDSWMVETGSFMRHEPFARLGLLLYLTVLHLWSFALVVFHTTEVEHGDFGSMDSNPRHWREHT